MGESKAAKIWRRTWIGALMVAAVTALITATHRTARAEFILAVTLPLGIVGALELGRMRKLAGLPLGATAVAGVIALHWLGWVTVDARARVTEHYGSFVPPPYLGVEAGPYGLYTAVRPGVELFWAAAVASAVLGVQSWLRARGRGVPLRLAAATGALLLLWWLVSGHRHWYSSHDRFGLEHVWLAGLLTLPIALGGLAAAGRPALRSWLTHVGLSLWVAVGLAWLVHVWLDWGTGGLVALVVLSKIGDIAGYYVGNAIGRSHPFPSISPGKTTAGCVGSLVAGVAAGAALSAGGVLPPGPLGIASGALAGLVVNLAAQAGDLFESWVKRRAQVKDSATYFGPAGGVLDLVDSLLFSVPVAVLTWPLVFSA